MTSSRFGNTPGWRTSPSRPPSATATAIVACETVRTVWPINVADVNSTLAQISLPGRTEYYPARPALLFDVAHNVEKATALRSALERHFAGRPMTLVVAIAEEKDSSGMLEAWSGLAAQCIFTHFEVSHRRSRHARMLANAASQMGLVARAIDDPVEALGLARRLTPSSGIVVVTGSTFLVSRLREWFLNDAREDASLHAGAY